MDAMSAYDVLGVDPGASADEVRRAYRAGARALHPDHHGGDVAHDEAMRRLNEAYALIGEPARRAAYDRMLSGRSGAEGAAAVDWAPVVDDVPTSTRLFLFHRVRVRIGVALMLGVLAVIFVFSAYAGSVGGGTSAH